MGTDGEKLFLIHCPMRDVDEFRELAKQAKRLAEFGRVLVNISELADKSWHEMPEGGSPWHEYANHNPTPYKFFPHEKIAPHVPADWVEANRELLLAKAEVLAEEGLEAAFWSYEPNMVPESFFEEHPHLRGARIDHPRRSRKEAFAMCVDLPEVLEMTESMMAELKRNVPHLGAFMFKTNDAGSGLCWSENLYTGANGPAHCAQRSTGERVRGLLEAIHRGAEAGGGDVDVHMSGNITGNELDKIKAALPARSYLRGRDGTSMSISSMIDSGGYPVLGMIDPMAIISGMQRFAKPDVRNVFVNFRASYDRGHESIEAVEKAIDIMADCVAEPTSTLMERLQKMRRLAAAWAGDESGEAVFESFVGLHEAFGAQRLVAPRFSPYYVGVSVRHMTRPLVIRPDLLTGEEESYWLPHVFNVHESEARTDWIDLHGGRFSGGAIAKGADPRVGGLRSVLGRVRGVAGVLEKAAAAGAPEAEWLGRYATGLRMLASIVRSCNNFYGGQIVRDRNAEALSGEGRIPPKEATWFGDNDLLIWNDIQRDEFDNVRELIDLLEKRGGLDLLWRAKDARDEDTFLLGPDIVEQLTKKAAIMRRHWRDVEQYLTTPLR